MENSTKEFDPYSTPYIKSSVDKISPGSVFGEFVRIGYGVVIEAGCVIGNNVFIGHNTVLRSETMIGNNSIISHLCVSEGNVYIGSNVTIEPQCHLTKGLVVEDNVFMGPGVLTLNTKRIVHGREIPLIIDPPRIKFAARIGAGVIICPGVTIGENAMVCAGVRTTLDVGDGCKMVNSGRYVGVSKNELLRREE